MTTAIAAHAIFQIHKPRIVLCMDGLAGDGTSSVEHADKIDLEFPGRLVCLTAGTIEDIRDLLRIYKSRIGHDVTRNGLKVAPYSGMKVFLRELKNYGIAFKRTSDRLRRASLSFSYGIR